jgi:hypothetical protein
MLEYGRTTAQGTGLGAGNGGDRDITGDIVTAVTNAVDQVISLPPEILISGAVVAVIGVILLRR